MPLHRAPIVRLIIPFIAGILAGYYFPIPIGLIIVGLIICSAALLFFVVTKPNWQAKLSFSVFPGIVINSTLLFAGLLAIYFNSPHNFKNNLVNIPPQKTLLVRLLENPEEKNKTYRALAQAEWVNTNDSLTASKGKLWVYFPKKGYDSTLAYGDYVIINGNLQTPQPPLNPNEFDYSRWLANQNIYFQVFLKQGEYSKTGVNFTNPIYKIANTARTYFNGVLQQFLPDSVTYGVAAALILGQRGDVPDELTNAYARTGTIHVLAVSGLHVGAIYLLLGWLLLFFNRTKTLRIFRTLIILTVLWGYAVLTGLAPSILRATVMFSFIVIGDTIGRKTNLFNSLAASALFILCVDAKALFNIGFQLSYLAVAGIGLLYLPLYRLITLKNKIVDYCWQLVSVSIAAQIATFALGIFYFHQFPNYFLLSNLIIVPLSILAVYVGIVLFIASPIPFISIWMGKGLHYLLLACNRTAVGIEHWPLSYSGGLYLSFGGMILVYLAIIALGIFIASKKYTALVVCLSFCIGLASLHLYRNYTTRQNKEFTVYALPYEQKAISYIEKNEAWIWADSSITQHSLTYRQKIEPHLIAANISKVNFTYGDSVFANNFGIYGGRYIALQGLKVLWVADENPVTASEEVEWDVVILSPKVKTDKLASLIRYRQLVVTSPFSKNTTTETHNVALDGAYRIQF
ncbi:MAG: ComEC family competence protein [Bacteroidetes bacterium]|nr:MAG: ComEC family competence protein [Bacteroidota bacterium]